MPFFPPRNPRAQSSLGGRGASCRFDLTWNCSVIRPLTVLDVFACMSTSADLCTARSATAVQKIAQHVGCWHNRGLLKSMTEIPTANWAAFFFDPLVTPSKIAKLSYGVTLHCFLYVCSCGNEIANSWHSGNRALSSCPAAAAAYPYPPQCVLVRGGTGKSCFFLFLIFILASARWEAWHCNPLGVKDSVGWVDSLEERARLLISSHGGNSFSNALPSADDDESQHALLSFRLCLFLSVPWGRQWANRH